MAQRSQKPKRSPAHRFIFKCSWRGTSLRLIVDANDLEKAYKKAEYEVMHMQGGASCMSVDCIRQEY